MKLPGWLNMLFKSTLERWSVNPFRRNSGTESKIKRKLHTNGSSSDFFVDKVLGDKIKKELMKTKSELQLSDDQIEVISTRLPIDKADLKKFFPKKWCDQHGKTVLEVMRKEFKDHVNEMKNMSTSAMELHLDLRKIFGFLRLLKECKWVHLPIYLTAWKKPDMFFSNQLIHMYSECGYYDDAREIEKKQRHIEENNDMPPFCGRNDFCLY